jgi:hypothetical protein
MQNKQSNFAKINFPEQGGPGRYIFSSIKNSLRAKFKRLKRILSLWATKCKLGKCMNYACLKGIGTKK